MPTFLSLSQLSDFLVKELSKIDPKALTLGNAAPHLAVDPEVLDITVTGLAPGPKNTPQPLTYRFLIPSAKNEVTLSKHTDADAEELSKMAVRSHPMLDMLSTRLADDSDYQSIFALNFPACRRLFGRRLPVYNAILNRITLVNTDEVGTLAVGWNPELRNFCLYYNPWFILKAAIDEFFYNRDSYDSFESAYFYFTAFGFIHEVSHILMTHTSDFNHLEDIPHDRINRTADIYINLECAKLLDDPTFVRKVTYPASGYFNEDVYTGGLAPDVINDANFVYSTVSSLLKTYAGKVLRPSGSVSIQPPKVWMPDSEGVVRIRFPVSTVMDMFNGRSEPMVRLVDKLVATLLVEPKSVNQSQQTQQGQQGKQGQSSGGGGGQSGQSQGSGPSGGPPDSGQSGQGGSGQQGQDGQGAGGSGQGQSSGQSQPSQGSGSGQQPSQGSGSGGSGQSSGQSQAGTGGLGSSQSPGDKGGSLAEAAAQAAHSAGSQRAQDQDKLGDPISGSSGSAEADAEKQEQQAKAREVLKDTVSNSIKDAGKGASPGSVQGTSSGAGTGGAESDSLKRMGAENLVGPIMTELGAWKAKLAAVLRRALSVDVRSDPNTPSARLEGELGREVDVRKISNIILSIDCLAWEPS